MPIAIRPVARSLILALSLVWSGPTLTAIAQEQVQEPPPQQQPPPQEQKQEQERDQRQDQRQDQKQDRAGRPAEPPADERLLVDYINRLPIGSHVRVRLLSGDSFKAVLMRVDGDALLVKPRTRTPRPERRIPLSEIDFVDPEPPDGNKTGKLVGIAVAASAATFFGIILLLRALYGD